jgi:hypothetical protein
LGFRVFPDGLVAAVVAEGLEVAAPGVGVGDGRGGGHADLSGAVVGAVAWGVVLVLGCPSLGLRLGTHSIVLFCSIELDNSTLTMEPHDILLILLVVNHLRPLNNLTIRNVRIRLRREDMAHSLPRDEITAAVAVDSDETRKEKKNL